MSRSGYSDDEDDMLALYRWRGQVASAIRGKRGQAFLRDLAMALDAMPVKRLISNELISEPPAFIPPAIANRVPPAVCAIGSLGVVRGVDLKSLDPENYDAIADKFGIAHQLVQEVEFMNDEYSYKIETPEQKWERMREWVRANIRE